MHNERRGRRSAAGQPGCGAPVGVPCARTTIWASGSPWASSPA